MGQLKMLTNLAIHASLVAGKKYKRTFRYTTVESISKQRNSFLRLICST